MTTLNCITYYDKSTYTLNCISRLTLKTVPCEFIQNVFIKKMLIEHILVGHSIQGGPDRVSGPV